MAESRPPLAVVGLSALFPGSQDAAGFWRDILAGRDLLSDVPPSHWLVEDYYDPDPAAPDKTYARRGGFLSPVEFDPLEHGIPPNVVPATDTSQLLALVAAKQVLDDAIAGQFDHVDREKTSIILGVTSAQELLVEMGARLQRPVWVKALREHGLPEDEVQRVCDRIADSYVPWQENTFPGLLGNVVAGRIANRLNLGGTNCITDAACASSFSALQMGANELYLGQSDLVIVGGVETFNDIFMYMCFSKTPALSPSGDCRPFAKSADGTMLGEGLALLALRRLGDAERDGDRIYAVVRGIGASSDGRNKSVYAPAPEGQAKALRRAYAAAGYSPATVELIEAHGTGTKAGDVAEFEGLRQVFEETGRPARQWCALGSLKSQIGHTKATAGAAGLFKIVMALHHKVLPPTIKVDEPHPVLQIERTPFYLNTRSRPWIRAAAQPRRASVSAFGFGGSNFHVAAEEYTGPAARHPRTATWPSELVLLSAADPAALVARCREVIGETGTPGVLASLARESHARFVWSLPARLALVASDAAELRRQLEHAATTIGAAPETPSSTPQGPHYALGAAPGRIAFLFPGQGSQYLEMGADLAMAFEPARAAWDRAAALELPTPLHEVVFPRPVFDGAARQQLEARLTATESAQPAVGVASAAFLALLQRLGVAPDVCAGHSFGEVTALFAAGALEYDDFLRVARRRGELMAEAARTPGAMLAVAAPLDAVGAGLGSLIDRVVVANHNGPRQVVLSGATDAIEAAAARLSEAGLIARRLPVATAFHSPIVAPAAAPFAAFLGDVPFRTPACAVYSNAEAAAYPGDPDATRERLAAQIARPVRFVEMIEALYAAGVRTFVEVGPGAVLTGLVGECLAGRAHHAVALDRKGAHGVASLWAALGRLAVAGVRLDLPALLADFAPPKDPRTRKKPALALSISGANYAKPYPPAGGAAALPKPNPPRPTPVTADPRASTASTPIPSAPAHGPADTPAWVQAYTEVQRQTAEAHEAYLRTMAESHTAFLKAAEASFAAIHTLIEGQPSFVGRALPHAAPEVPVPVPAVAAAVATPPLVAAPAPEPVVAAASPAPAAGADLKGLLLAVVSEKTGYPPEMLSLEMGLESDLGIDSIKRVEILAAVQEHVPGLPEIKPSEMAALRTLGEVVAFLDRAPQPAAPAAAQAEGLASAPAPGPAAGNGTHELEATLVAVVAEKTGYPAEMLSPEMELESDLGIDSIKRVEILAALQERVPGLPEVKPAEIAALRTLGQIVARMKSAPHLGAANEPPPTAGERLARWILREREAPSLGAALPGLFDAGPIYVTDDEQGVASALAERLAAHGVDARLVPEVPDGARAAILLEGLRPLGAIDDAAACARRAFRAARTLAPQLSGSAGVFVTVQDTGGDFGLAGREPMAAWLAGLAALAKTAAREWPAAAVRALDVERAGRAPGAVAEAIAAELISGGCETEVGLRADGRRTTLVAEAAEVGAAASAAGIDERSVLVASGGARGVTAACMIALAQARRPRIALLGRTPLADEPAELRGVLGESELLRALHARERESGRDPKAPELRQLVQRVQAAREARRTLEALAAAGCEAMYLAADVSSERELRRALAEVRSRFGPVTGLVHGAGVLADKRIGDKSDAQFSRVFDTKTLGLRALLAATSEDPLRLLCVFSSVAARSGNPGQADYAMANEALAKVAAAEARRRGPGCLVKAIHWGPWDGGMVDASLRAHFAARGVPLIPLAAGARHFVDELCGSAGQEIEVIVGGAGASPALEAHGERLSLLDFHVCRDTHPYLDGHRVKGVPVLPVVLALEWMARAAAACRPDLVLAELYDVRVLRGIRLTRFDGDGETFRVSCRETSNGSGARLVLELRAPDGALHYGASAEMRPEAPPAPPEARPASAPGAAPWPVEALYPRLLFHDGAFRLIRELESLDATAGEARLSGLSGAGWAGGPWQLEAAGLDGGLQLAILLGQVAHGQASLPTRIGRLRLFRRGPAAGEIRCRIAARPAAPLRTSADISFLDADGGLFAEMTDVELHALPAEVAATTPAAMPAAEIA